MSRSVQMVFDQYRIQRNTFAATVAELSMRAECVQQLIQQGAIVLLRNLLTDSSQAIQQNAALGIGRLASHDPKIAELMIKQDIVRILLYFNMDKTNKYLKRTALMAIRSVVRHSAELSKSVIDMGGLDQIIGSLEEFDPGVKEAAAWVCGYIARHDQASAYSIIGAGAVPLLILCLQEPELSLRGVAASALSDVCKHSPETAQSVLDSGVVFHLVRSLDSADPKLQRQALNCLGSIAKHSLHMAEIILEAGVVPIALKHCGHTDENVRRAAAGLIREIVKHTPETATLIVEAGGLGVLVNSVVRNRGDAKLPGIMCLGYIAAHDPKLAMSVIASKGTDALSLALDEGATYGHVAAASAWALGHIARHSAEHARSVSLCGLLPKILDMYMDPCSSEEAKEKSKTALKMFLFKIEDLDCLGPLLSTAPPNILKYIVAQYSKILPRDPLARRAFVTSSGLQKLQQILNGPGAEDPILREHIQLINQCFPEEIVKYFSPDYPLTLLDQVESYRPTLNIDPSLWSERLFSDANIPGDISQQIQELQQYLLHQGAPPAPIPEEAEEEEEAVPAPPQEEVPPPPAPQASAVKVSATNRKGSKKKSADVGGGDTIGRKSK